MFRDNRPNTPRKYRAAILAALAGTGISTAACGPSTYPTHPAGPGLIVPTLPETSASASTTPSPNPEDQDLQNGAKELTASAKQNATAILHDAKSSKSQVSISPGGGNNSVAINANQGKLINDTFPEISFHDENGRIYVSSDDPYYPDKPGQPAIQTSVYNGIDITFNAADPTYFDDLRHAGKVPQIDNYIHEINQTGTTVEIIKLTHPDSNRVPGIVEQEEQRIGGDFAYTTYRDGTSEPTVTPVPAGAANANAFNAESQKVQRELHAGVEKQPN